MAGVAVLDYDGEVGCTQRREWRDIEATGTSLRGRRGYGCLFRLGRYDVDVPGGVAGKAAELGVAGAGVGAGAGAVNVEN